jgi:fatty acid synthase
VISKHDTSTLANDPNETELHERLADSMGRSAGAPLFIVSQKSLTGHAKGGAAVFQMMGLCQVLRDGVIPAEPQPGLRRRRAGHLGALRVAARDVAAGREVPAQGGSGDQPRLRSRVGSDRAGASAGVPGRAEPRAAGGLHRRAQERVLAGQRRLASAIAGGRPMYEARRSPVRPRSAGEAQEAAMLLDPASRLGEDDTYVR